MAIDWLSFTNEDDVWQVVGEQLPVRSSLDRIRSFADAEHLECSEPTDDIIYCSAPARSEMRHVRQ